MIRAFKSLPSYMQLALGGAFAWLVLTRANESIANYWAGALTVLVAICAWSGGGWGNGGDDGDDVSDPTPPDGDGIPVPVVVETREVSALTADALISEWATMPAEREAVRD